jgi:hypothetical protein
MFVASEPACSIAGNLCWRIGDCRRADTHCEFVADRSRDSIGSTPFTPFWRVCRKAFLTSPYNKCTLQDHNSAKISASLPTLADGRASMVHTLLFTIRSQSRSSSRRQRSSECGCAPRTNWAAIEHRLRSDRDTRLTPRHTVDGDGLRDAATSEMRHARCFELGTVGATFEARTLPMLVPDSWP